MDIIDLSQSYSKTINVTEYFSFEKNNLVKVQKYLTIKYLDQDMVLEPGQFYTMPPVSPNIYVCCAMIWFQSSYNNIVFKHGIPIWDSTVFIMGKVRCIYLLFRLLKNHIGVIQSYKTMMYASYALIHTYVKNHTDNVLVFIMFCILMYYLTECIGSV